jgi:hypothetical protein
MNQAQLYIELLEEFRPKESLYLKHVENWNLIFSKLKSYFARPMEVLEIPDVPVIASILLNTLTNTGNDINNLLDLELLKNGTVKVRMTTKLGCLFAVKLVLTIFKSQLEWEDKKTVKEEWEKIYAGYMSLLNMMPTGLNFNLEELN